MSLDPIIQNVIDGLVLGQQTIAMRSPGMEPPRPMGCPNCAQAEAQCDRLAQRIRELESALAFRDADVASLSLEIKRLNDVAQTAGFSLVLAEGEKMSLLMLLAQISEAVGDNGRRMQGELIDYLRILWEEADPDRVSAREAEVRAQDYATPHDPSDSGAWGEDRFEAAS